MCSEPITSLTSLPPEIRDKVYRPGVDETYNIEVDLEKPKHYVPDDGSEIE